jgi:MFS family permease
MKKTVSGQKDFDQQERTFRIEVLRAFPAGFIDTAATSFVIFFAIQVFEMHWAIKAAMLAASSVGQLCSLFIVQLARRFGRPVNILAACIWLISFIGFAVASVSGNHAIIYFVGCVIAFISLGMSAPLTAQIYRMHYASDKRGRLFSITSLIRAGVAGAISWFIGSWLKSRGNDFSPLFWGYAAACLMMAGCVLLMAPVVLRQTLRLKWFDAFRHVSEDAPFRKLLMVWMVFGFGNLVSLALFVEYITHPLYGYHYGPKNVGLITGTVPMLAFIVFVVPWGMVFDRLPFYTVRALVNVFFIVGILIYYLGSGFMALCVGIALHGIARSGGEIIWTLWVTKFANSDKVVEYMSVHTFLTGIRGVIAPFIAFMVAAYASPSWVAWISAGLIFISTLTIFPEILEENRRRKELEA